MLSSWTGHHQPSPEQVLALAPTQAQAAYPPCSPRGRQRDSPASGQQVGHPSGVQGLVQPGQQRLADRDVHGQHHVGQELLLDGGDPPASTASSLAFRTSTRARQACRSACS